MSEITSYFKCLQKYQIMLKRFSLLKWWVHKRAFIKRRYKIDQWIRI